MSERHYSVDLKFDIPVVVTAGVFETANPVFRNLITRRGAGRCHRLLVVVDQGVATAQPGLVAAITTYARTYADSLALVCPPVVVPGGEDVKQGLDHALQIVSLVNDYGIDRQSFIVAVGGGAVLDMVSFAAAIAHRGVRVVRVPTTTLAQGDSGIAVKNSVNLFGKKNFAGTFTPPFGVINDVKFLSMLSARDRRSGLSEAVKVAVLRDPAFFAWLEQHATSLDAGDLELLAEAVGRSATLHLEHICGSGDPFEFGSARPLDFGHWAAHKLEALTDHAIRHGEAVAVGLALDLCYSVRAGFLAQDVADRVMQVLTNLGFVLYDEGLTSRTVGGEWSLLEGLREFREHLGGDLHITLLRDIGDGFETHEMHSPLVLAAIDDLAARAGQAPAPVAVRSSGL
jgi:3-dehydroquinate synthase